MSEAQVVWGLTGFLFLAGAAALVLRRQLLAMLLGLELMANAANVALVYQARLFGDPSGPAAVFLLLGVAACEAVVAMALILTLYRLTESAGSDAVRELRG